MFRGLANGITRDGGAGGGLTALNRLIGPNRFGRSRSAAMGAVGMPVASSLSEFVEQTGRAPLAWAGSTTRMNYLNFGDALSPVMVALCCGLPVERIPFNAGTPRIAAVGTIGHGIGGSLVWFWGTGSSNYRNPAAPQADRELYRPPAGAEFHFHATRGPISRRILSGAEPPADAVYGDPVWLLPRFYRPQMEKRWELGVILHLSELSDREFEAHPQPGFLRYDIPAEFQGSIRLINTVTAIEVTALKRRLDDILACKRIVSTSLHGMVVPESYGIPCLYFAPNGPVHGLGRSLVDPEAGLDLRIVDFYAGLGVEELPIYVQPRHKATDWEDLIRAIDLAWQPKRFDGEALLDAFPVAAAPLAPPTEGTLFDHPVLQGLRLQHDVAELQQTERSRAAQRSRARPAGGSRR
jgi:pyruvyltransferase